MSRIHPTKNKGNDDNNDDHHHMPQKGKGKGKGKSLCVLTVWKRSSMSFQGTDGFTVFDQTGELVFRVDNYSRKNGYDKDDGLVLMDGAGIPLLTLKPQILRLQTQWNVYKGGEECVKISSKSVFFSIRSRSSVFFSNSKNNSTEVFMGGLREHDQTPDYTIEGSFRTRDCKIRKCSTGKVVAKMARKKVNTTILLGNDVFSLVVKPGFDTQLAMAVVIILDRISSKPFAPLLCS